MELKLRKDLVLVEPFEQPSTIIIPDGVRRDCHYGKVINSSYGDVTEGDEIAYSEHTGEKTHIYGKTLLVMKAEDVLAVV